MSTETRFWVACGLLACAAACVFVAGFLMAGAHTPLELVGYRQTAMIKSYWPWGMAAVGLMILAFIVMPEEDR